MSNNTQLNPGNHGDVIHTIDESGVKTQVVYIGGGLSGGNSTTTALGADETYTGTSELNVHPDVMVSCFSNVAGTLYFDFSVNGTDWRTFPSSGFAVAANIHEFHTAVKGPRYFRVRFVNGSSIQTTFQLSTYYGQFGQPSAPMNQNLGLDNDAIAVRPTLPQDEIRLGLRSGVTGWNKFGYRTGLTAAGGEESIWDASGNFTILTSASTFTITYNNTTDGLGTTGATQLYFYYIDSNGLPAITPHTLGNTGTDVTSFSGLGINRCVVAANGGATYNTNAITVTATTGGSTQAIIPALQSVTQQAIFFNGSNHTAIAKFLFLSVQASTKTATILVKGYIYNREFNTRYEIFRTTVDTAVALDATFTDPIGFAMNPTDVLYFVADSDSNSVGISCRFSLNQYQAT